MSSVDAPRPAAFYYCANPRCAGKTFLARELQWWDGSPSCPAGWYCLRGEQSCIWLCTASSFKACVEAITLVFRELAKAMSVIMADAEKRAAERIAAASQKNGHR